MEKSSPADQLDHPALRLIAARPDLFARRGHVATSYRRRSGKQFGPYYRLVYRDGVRQTSIYLGRNGPLVRRVRNSLDLLQRPHRQSRTLLRLERRIRAALRLEKRHLSSLLQPYGLRLKGFELRGMRFSPLRRFLPRRRISPRLVIVGKKPARFQANHDPPPVRLERFLEARRRLYGW